MRPISAGRLHPSSSTSAAPSEMAGVMPVQWNQLASAKTARQSTMPGWMVAMAESSRS